MGSDIVLYSAEFCPKCKLLKKELDKKNIQYINIEDRNICIEKNIDEVPILEINGERYDWQQAIEKIKNGEV